MPVVFKRKIVKIGGSYRLTIPKEIVESMQISEGDELSIWMDDSTVMFKKE